MKSFKTKMAAAGFLAAVFSFAGSRVDAAASQASTALGNFQTAYKNLQVSIKI